MDPGYVRVADALRQRIESGEFPPGQRLPSQAGIAAEYETTAAVARGALRLLAAEGRVLLGMGRVGVVLDPQRRRVVDLDVLPDPATFEAVSEPVAAPGVVAGRLGVDVGAPVMRTLYRHREEHGLTVWVTVSWEPLAVTGTRLESVPEVGEHRGAGVAARMARIGVTVAWVEWRFVSRPASHEEARELGVAAGSALTVVERTHVDVDGRRVETADLIAPSGRCEFVHASAVAPLTRRRG